MTGSLGKLPEYSKPPVIETVLGIEFAPIEGFGLLEIGALRDEWRRQYPRHQIMPPLPSMVAGSQGGGIEDSVAIVATLSSSPQFRVWMVSKDGSRLIQVQDTRLLYNWRSVPGAPGYPRYSALRNDFEALWEDFVEFLEDRKLTAPTILACEVSYVNHLETGREFETFEDLRRIFPFWSLTEGDFLPSPALGGFRLVFPMTTSGGSLEVTLEPAVRHTDLNNILQFQLVARGVVKTDDFDDALDWLDAGHEWIVRGFTDLTSVDMHTLWERSR